VHGEFAYQQLKCGIGVGVHHPAACHVRVGDETTFFGLPEGQRGIYLGGGGSVRIARLIGLSRIQGNDADRSRRHR
jgi:enoyl-CoA hydratase/carnithine racemase